MILIYWSHELFQMKMSEIMEDALRIFRSNAEVDAYNTKVLASLNTEGATADAYDFCVGDGLASIREKVLSNVKKLKTSETYGLPLQIDLKVGCQVYDDCEFGCWRRISQWCLWTVDNDWLWKAAED